MSKKVSKRGERGRKHSSLSPSVFTSRASVTAHPMPSRASTEVATRTTLALACLCFVLIGIPLGIQNHRRESSAGLSIALVVAGGFYLFCLTGESLAKNPDRNAYWLVLVPGPVSLILSRYFLRKNN